MRKVILFYAMLLLFSLNVVAAQENGGGGDDLEDFWDLGGGFALNPVFIQPSSRIYFDKGADEQNELDLFDDGRLALAFQAVGFDLGGRLNDDKVYIGVSIGFGISTATGGNSGAAALTISYNIFTDLAEVFRLELGKITGYSAGENLRDIDDTAYFAGIALPTALGNKVAEAISE